MTDLLWLLLPAIFGAMSAALFALARREAREARLYDLMTNAPLRDLVNLIQNSDNIR